MKKLIWTIMILTVTSSAQMKITEQSIINSGEFYYGSGTSQIINEAQDEALSELTKQIAVNIFSSYKEKIKEEDEEVTESTEKILNSYSTATLRNVNFIKKPQEEGTFYVFCYLKKSEVEKIFQERIELVHEIVSKAREYQEAKNFAYALKLYYFSSILLNSLPYENIIYEDINYTNEIPSLINEIILDIDFKYTGNEIISDKEREVTLDVTYKDEPVTVLDFRFWDGSNQVSVQAKDGKAAFTLLGSSREFDQLGLSIKYSYYECRQEYAAVNQLWDLVKKSRFKSLKQVDISGEPPALKTEHNFSEANRFYETTFDSDYDLSILSEEAKSPNETIAKNTIEFLEILNKDATTIKDVYANDSFLKSKILNYVNFNNPSVQDQKIEMQLFAYDDGWELRRVRMLHSYPSIQKQSTEYLVLDFSVDGKLRDINVAINENLYDRFVREGDLVDDWYNRQRIIKFIEKYRTAYITRDIETVDKFFAEDALIIVGRKIKKKDFNPENMYTKNEEQPDYEYLRLKKNEFINRQQQIFKAQKDIFLDFASFDIIRKNNAPDVYGVEMRQNYFSTTYADEGHLFLLIDFEPENPMIYVRAWQPNAWKESELIRTANFQVHK